MTASTASSPPSLLRVGDYVDLYASTTPDAIAAIDGDRTLTYAELARDVERLQRVLLELGVTHGDRVATLAVPSTDYYVILLATIGLGAIWVGLNPRHTYAELSYVVGDCAPRVVFHITEFEGRDYRADIARLAREHGFIAICHSERSEESRSRSEESRTDADDADLAALRAAVDEMDPAIIVYTSGSTGAPKGALLTHHALIYGAVAQVKRWALERVDQLCYWPINHIACVGDVTLTTLVAGGTLTFQPRFDPATALPAIAAGRMNVLLAVPTMLQLLMAHPSFTPDSFANVNLIVVGGSAPSRALIERLMTLRGPRLATLYGMTEAAANTTYTDEGASVEELADTIGKPLPGFPTRIVTDEGRECAVGEPGEIQHRGRYMTPGYFNRPDATREAFTDDGWYRTGDVGFWRGDGNIQLVGRMKEMFKSGGYNVYPREIEIALERHPAVEMVAVVAVPDDLYGEVGAAFVTPRAGHGPAEDDLRVWCRERLANYKIPKRFFVRDDVPRLPVGKIDKVALRAEAVRTMAMGAARS